MRLQLGVAAVLGAASLLTGCSPASAGADPGTAPPPRASADSGQMCGGLAGIACRKPGDFCRYAPAARCGAADQSGTCTPKPQACTREYRPVCGCDGKTYGNPCEASAAGASVASEGACQA